MSVTTVLNLLQLVHKNPDDTRWHQSDFFFLLTRYRMVHFPIYLFYSEQMDTPKYS